MPFRELLDSTEMKTFWLLVTYILVLRDCISINIAHDKVPSLFIHEIYLIFLRKYVRVDSFILNF